MTNNNTKICGRCGIEKELYEFNNMTASNDGKQNRCRECSSMGKKEWRAKNRDAVNEDNKKYYNSHKEAYFEYNKQYVKENPEKVKVWARTQQSMRRGWESPQPINSDFEGSHLHHLHLLIDGEIDHRIAIYIPAELHESARHAYNNPEKMAAINKLAFEWLATCDVI